MPDQTRQIRAKTPVKATSYARHNLVMQQLVGSRVGEKDQRVDEMVSLLDSWLPRSK
ncbi:hypothetical protein [Alloscardovia omnicolens]|uniref:hypothetical protein n=1 Tax=Alloscardovia omnicolens TaxID=419015 RepID=UPI000ADEA51D|nr:hypothetical protein [Alloscardovia omnicolens]